MRIRLLAELALLCSAQIPQPRNVAPPLPEISAVGLINLIIFLWVVGSIIATVTYPMY